MSSSTDFENLTQWRNVFGRGFLSVLLNAVAMLEWGEIQGLEASTGGLDSDNWSQSEVKGRKLKTFDLRLPHQPYMQCQYAEPPPLRVGLGTKEREQRRRHDNEASLKFEPQPKEGEHQVNS